MAKANILGNINNMKNLETTLKYLMPETEWQSMYATNALFQKPLEAIITEPAFIDAILELKETGSKTPLLYWLSSTPSGFKILTDCFNNVDFKEQLLKNRRFICALLAPKNGKTGRKSTFECMFDLSEDKDISAFYWLSSTQEGLNILTQCFENFNFRQQILFR